jgi:1-acyl-sn-glycerol-3-phosphate acyltransferase
MSPATPKAIRVVRGLRLALCLASIMLGTLVLYPWLGAAGRARFKQRWSLRILDTLCVQLDAEACPWPPGGLIVSNHVSWLDIFVINALRPSAFIAKAEIRQWPLIGWLGQRNDTVFLRRGSRGHARVVNGQIDALLNSGSDVAIFPEGTTTDGTHLLNFHAALLQPAIETGSAILPLALSYHDARGKLSLAPSFAGETTLPQCLMAIFACRSLTARLRPAPAIATAGQTRRELSQAAHDAIATRLGFPAANKAPERSPDPRAG